ncbi:SdrD B-like domain-containing protein [Macrococcoides caseolyticum]|uniref:collagen-flanked surface repeat-containing protein n=1 Tax=Macrococcoides caseolyticum TaxID=69966 RepID=UPI0024BCA536|nr:SdrD B-like domain-containing protein [Macrococcus caseolyticus]MDJ1089561.1 SdrD B-like domain-containing protein [Macrococcus caseolyticus]
MNKKPNSKRFDFIPNRLNKYSIRKFTVGTSSILIGSLMFLGDTQSAQAEETTATITQQATVESSKTEAPSTEATTEAPTTESKSTEATTEAPTTESKSTEATTEAPTTESKSTETTEALTTESKSTETTEAPTTESKSTETTEAPTTESKSTETTEAPTTESKTTETTTEAPTTESKTTETTTEAPTTESKTTEGNNVGAITDSKSTETTVAEKVVTPTTESITAVFETLNNGSTTEDKQKTLSDYYAENTGVSSEEAIQTVDNLNLDYNNLSSDELMAALLQAIATEQNANTVQATAPQKSRALTDAESNLLSANESNTTRLFSPRTFSTLNGSVSPLSFNTLAAQSVSTLAATSADAASGPREVNDLVEANTTFEITGGGKGKNEVWITTNGILKLNTTYKVDDRVKEGDYFTMDFGDNIHPGTYEKPYGVGNLLDVNGSTIAIGSYDAEKNIATYKFTNYVDVHDNVSGAFTINSHPFRDKVTDNKQTVLVTVSTAGETTNQNITFDYGNRKTKGITSSLDYHLGNTSTFTTYVNQSHLPTYNATVNLRGEGYKFSDPSQIEIYKVTNDSQFRDSFSPDYSKLTKVSAPVKINSDGSATVDLGNIVKDGYIIKSTANKLATPTGARDFTSEMSFATVRNGAKTQDANTSYITSSSAGSTGEGTNAKYSIGDKVWVDTNKDGIQNENGTGLSNVTVNLLDSTGIRIATTTTDSNGNYKFDGLSNGNYQVEVVKPEGYNFTTPKSGSDDSVDSDMVFNNGKYIAPVTINNANVTTIDAGLVPETYTIGDRVWEDSNKDGVQTDEEPGIENVTVILKDKNNVEITRTTTDSSGNYSFPNLSNGTYNIEFLTPEGYSPTQSGAGSDRTKDSNGNNAIVTINNSNDNTIDSGFIKKEVTSPSSVYDIGDYVWEDSNEDGLQTPGEKGVPGVQVLLKDANNHTIQTTITDNDGNYGFYGVPKGKYTVEFIVPGMYSTTTTGKNPASANDSNGIKTTFDLTADNKTIDLGLVKQPSTVKPEYELTIDDVSYEVVVRENKSLSENTISLVQQGADGRERVVYQLNPGVDPSTMTATNNEEFYSKYFTEVSRQVIYSPQDAIIEYNLPNPVSNIVYNPTTNTYDVTYVDGTKETLPGQTPDTITTETERGTGSIDGGAEVPGTWIYFYTVDANGVRNPDPYDSTFIPDGADGQDGVDGAPGTPGANGQDGQSPLVTTDRDDKARTTTVTFYYDVDGDGIYTPGVDTLIREEVIYDGQDGIDGKDGIDGEDGKSPTATIKDNGDGTHTITIVNPDGTETTTVVKDGKDGKSPTATVKDNGDGTHTITIVNPDGTVTTTIVKNGVDGKDGIDGKSPTATVTDNGDGTHTITIVNPDGTETTTVVKDGAKGDTGAKGEDGKDGKSPTATVKDNGDGTHTITIINPDGTETTTVVKDGKDGKSPTATVKDNGDGTHTITIVNPDGTETTTVVKDGAKGEDGKDGKSPTATIKDNGDGTHTITIINPDGTETTTVVKDGKSPTATVKDNGDGTHTITIVNPDGTVTTTIVKNGVDGKVGIDGKSPTATVKDNGDGTHTITIVNPDGTVTTTIVKNGVDGKDGIDGKSPTATVTDNGDGTHTITIVNPDGTETTTVVKDGAKGEDGKDGKSPTATVKDNGDGTHTITIVNPDGTVTTTIVKDDINGTNGKDGVDGKDGENGSNGSGTIINNNNNNINNNINVISIIINNDGDTVINYSNGSTTTIHTGGTDKSVVNVTIDKDGNIIVKYSDNTTEVIGNVSNLPGEDGKDGKDGKGISSTFIDKNGHLIIIYTDGTTNDLGKVTGQDGRSVTNTIINDKGELIVIYSDGTLDNLGIVKGPKGEDGKSAYQIWLEQGNKGSINDFLESLKGKDGKDCACDKVIVNISKNDHGDLVIKYIDGSTQIIKNDCNNPGTTDNNPGTIPGIKNVNVDHEGNVIVSTRGDDTIHAGKVNRGEVRVDENGQNIKEIANVYVDNNDNLIVVHNDYTADNLGKIRNTMTTSEELPDTGEANPGAAGAATVAGLGALMLYRSRRRA